MRHRKQLYLDPDQYRWLRQRAGTHGSIAAVVRRLIDDARASHEDAATDPLIRYLLDDPAVGRAPSSAIERLDRDVCG